MARKDGQAQFVVTENNAVAHEGTIHDAGTVVPAHHLKNMDVDRLVDAGALREATAEDFEAAERRAKGLDPVAPPSAEGPKGSEGTKEVDPNASPE